MSTGHGGHGLAAGVVVGGCRLRSQVGHGGMGTVYRAEQLTLGREVAVKVVPAEGVDAALVARFKREVRTAAALENPACIPIYAAGEEDGLLYMVMRLVQGPDLGTLIAGEAPLASERVLGLITQVAGALDAAHAAGLVHRDVKPANILVEPTEAGERAYLSDFGLMRRVLGATAITRAGEWVGTVDYVSPEQIEGRAVDHRADVYSLAAVLFACVTGRAPFAAADLSATARAHMSAPPPQLDPSDPAAALNPVIARGMAKLPQDRYPSAGALALAARQSLGGAPVMAGRPARPATVGPDRHDAPTTVSRPPRRGRWAAALALAVVACAGGAVAAAVALGGGHHHRATVHTHSTGPIGTAPTFAGQGYSFSYPAGWRVVEADDPEGGGNYFRTRLISPDGLQTLIVDHTPDDPQSVSAKAVSVAAATVNTRGYEARMFLPAVLGGRNVFEWEFILPLSPSGPPARIDVFERLGDTDYAVLGEAQSLGQITSTTLRVAESLRSR